MWIFQEAAVPENAVLMYKGLCLQLENIFLVVDTILENQTQLLALIHSIEPGAAEDVMSAKSTIEARDPEIFKQNLKACLKHRRTIQKHVQAGSKIPLLGLILSTRNFRCEDPRDKVFALLVMIEGDPDERLPFKQSYDDSVELIYLRTARHRLPSERRFSSLVLDSRGYGTDYIDVP
jgi:hypothetical protein